MTTETIRLGFMPLVDAAVPLVAARQGFAAAEGIALELVRETSWANIRDRLAIGHFDAAHLLAPMPIATALGLTPVNVPLIAPMALGQGGNAVTVSQALMEEMCLACPDLRLHDPRVAGAALREVVARRRRSGLPRLMLAVVHPFSSHNYELRYWLAASGIAPDADVEIGIVSPPLMPAALASGGIDGFCVGEPWNTVAAAQGVGTILLTKTEIWSASPEKVLSLRSDRAEQRPETVTRLVSAMLDAALWCDDPANHEALAQLLAAPDLLDLAPEMIRPVLAGGIVFAQNAACFPWISHARWFAGEMRRWNQTAADAGEIDRAIATYRPDIYRAAAARRDLNAPATDHLPERAGNVEIAGTRGPLTLQPSRFFDA